MVADKIIAVPAFRSGTAHDILRGPIVANHIEVGSGEMVNGVAKVAGDGQCLEENLRA